MSSGSKGGGKTTVNTDPWKPSQPYILQGLAGAQQAYNDTPMYTPRTWAQNYSDTLGTQYADQMPSLFNPYSQSAMGALGNPSAGINPYAQYGVSNAVGSGLQNPSAQSNPFGLGGAIQQGLQANPANQNPFGLGSAIQAGLQSPTANSNPFGINSAIQQGLNAPNVNSNPYIEQYAQAATRPLQQQLDMQTNPAIRSQYTGAGQYGSSRQGISEGVAQGLTNQAIGDTRAKIYSDAYGQGLGAQANALSAANTAYGQGLGAQANAMGAGNQLFGTGLQGNLGYGSLANSAYNTDVNRQLGTLGFTGDATGQGLTARNQALALYPQMMQAGLLPSSIYSTVGAGQQADMNAAQVEPWQRLQAYQAAINGTGGASQTTNGGGGNGWMGALGGLGMLGAMGGFGRLGGLFGGLFGGGGDGLGASSLGAFMG